MIKLLESIFGEASVKSDKFDPELIRLATDRLVEGTDPRLSAVSGYRERLRPAVEHTVEYVTQMVDSLTTPADLAQKNYLSDPRLRAFFASATHFRDKIAASQDINAFLNKTAGTPRHPVYALLSARLEERRSLGMQREGDIVRREVMQHVINFSGHQFLAVSYEDDATRWELKRRAYDNMVSVALARIVAARQEHQDSQREQRLLARKLRCLRDGRLGLSPGIEDAPRLDPRSVEREIAQIESDLATFTVETETLDDYLDLIAETLSAPGEHLTLLPLSITLDHMGRKIEAGSSTLAPTLALQEFTFNKHMRAIVLLVRIDPAELPPPRDFIKEARRYLG